MRLLTSGHTTPSGDGQHSLASQWQIPWISVQGTAQQELNISSDCRLLSHADHLKFSLLVSMQSIFFLLPSVHAFTGFPDIIKHLSQSSPELAAF